VLEKSALWFSGLGRFSCWASNFTISLAGWARAQALNCLRLAQGKQNLRTASPKGKLGYQL